MSRSLLVLALILAGERLTAAQNACHYLPTNRMRWWDVQPPLSGPLRATDDRSCWFNDALATEGQFKGATGARANDELWGVNIRDVGGSPATVDAVAAAAVGVRRDEPSSDPEKKFQAPMTFDYSFAQRAVMFQIGLRYDEGYHPSGIDPQGIELRAYDDRGYLVGMSTLADTEKGPITNARIDYFIGVRDQQARIAKVELLLREENAATFTTHADRRPIRATILLRHLWFEGLPPAGVLEGSVTTAAGSSIGAKTITLPSHLDRATALLRGYRFDVGAHPLPISIVDIDLFAFPVRVDASTTPPTRTIELQVSGTVDGGQSSPAALTVYYSLLAWDSRQVRVAVDDGQSISGSGTARASADVHIPNLCPGCGEVVSAPRGLNFTLFGHVEGWAVWHWNLGADAYSPYDPLLDLNARFETENGHPDFLFGARSVVMADESVNFAISSPPWGWVPNLTVIRPSAPDWDYGTATTRDLGMWGQVRGLVAAVAMRGVGVNAMEDIISVSDPSPVRAMDVELSAPSYDGQEAKLLIGGGGVDTEDSSSSTVHRNQYFATPVFVALEKAAGAWLTVEDLSFQAYLPGQTVSTSSGGGVHHGGGQGVQAVYDLQLVDPTGAFALTGVEYHGATLSLSWLRRYGITLAPGEALRVLGTYRGTAGRVSTATVNVWTSGSSTPREMRVTGRVVEAGHWAPDQLFVGTVTVGGSAQKNALFENTGSVAMTITSVSIVADAARSFSGPASFPSTLRPGEALIARISFRPTTVPPSTPPLGGDFQTAIVRVATTLGTWDLPVRGIATRPGQPAQEMTPSPLSYGLVVAGNRVIEQVTLRSTGTADLVVQRVSLRGDPAFRLSAPPVLPLTLPPGAELLIPVELTAAGAGGTRLSTYLEVQTASAFQAVPLAAVVAP